jgi:hypothetical protein
MGGRAVNSRVIAIRVPLTLYVRLLELAVKRKMTVANLIIEEATRLVEPSPTCQDRSVQPGEDHPAHAG